MVKSTFKERCISNDIDYQMAGYYRHRYKSMTEDEIFTTVRERMRLREKIPFKKKCLDANVNYSTATTYRTRYGVSDEEAIRRCQEGKVNYESKRVGERRQANNGKWMTLIAYRSFQDIDIQFDDGDIVRNKNYANFNIGNIAYPRVTFKDKCIKAGLNYKRAKAYRENHSELTDEEVIKIQLELSSKSGESFRSKCDKAGITYSAGYSYKASHKDLSDDEVIAICVSNKNRGQLKMLCKKYNIHYGNACSYKKRHKGISNEEIILFYRSDLELNIFGEIIE